MLGPRPVRRLVAVTATLGAAAALTAGVSTVAIAADEPTAVAGTAAAQKASGVAVRETRPGGSFLVRGSRLATHALDPALMTDLRTYARTSGEDLDNLVASHRGVDEVAAYLDGLEQRRPGSYVTGGLASPEDGDTAWVQFTERPGAAEVARMRDLPVDLRVSFGAPASFAELARLSSDLVDAASVDPAVRTAVAGYDPRARMMELTWSAAAPAANGRAVARSTVLDRVVTDVAEGSPGGELPVRVVARSGAEGLSTTETIKGGREINSNRFVCTAGFTAVRNGRRGVLTSGHCPDVVRYTNVAGTLAKARESTNRRIDLQWNPTRTGNGHRTVAKFRQRAGKPDRFVSRVANGPRGSVVCKYGRSSYYACSRIAVTNICGIFEGGEKFCQLDRTRRSISQPGDSGGPNFLGTRARGITTGGGDGFSVLTRISAVGDSLRGLRVMRRGGGR